MRVTKRPKWKETHKICSKQNVFYDISLLTRKQVKTILKHHLGKNLRLWKHALFVGQIQNENYQMLLTWKKVGSTFIMQSLAVFSETSYPFTFYSVIPPLLNYISKHKKKLHLQDML